MSTGLRTGPVYKPLMDSLRHTIREGHVKPGQQLGSERALMRETGLSRKSVRQAIERLMAENLVERRAGKGVFVAGSEVLTWQIQLVVPSLGFDQWVKVYRGVQNAVRKCHATVQVSDAHCSLDEDLKLIRGLPDNAGDGAIIGSFNHPVFSETIFELKRLGFPFVLVDEPVPGVRVPCITADQYQGGYSVGKALVDLGHRRIGFLGNLDDHNTTHRRLEGLRDAVLDARVLFDRNLVADLEIKDPLGDWTPAIRQKTRNLMRLPDRPTALFCANDTTAGHAYREIKALGLRIPDDVSVVGFDDDAVCEMLDPPLATVRQPSERIGAIAMDQLANLLTPASADHGSEDTPGTNSINGSNKQGLIVLPTQWVPRESVRVRQSNHYSSS